MNSKIFTCFMIVSLSAIFISSCKKENKEVKPIPTSVKPIEKKILNADEKALKLKLVQTSQVVAEVFKDDKLRKEFNDIVRKKVTETNIESVTFKELFSADSSNPEFKRYVSESFSKSFIASYRMVYNAKFGHLKPNNQNSNIKTYDNPDIYDRDPSGEIYFPYSQNFNPVDQSIQYSYTSYPVDNEAVNEGIVWNPNSGVWQEVLVDDQYAWANPTYIINITETIASGSTAIACTNCNPGNGQRVLIGEVMSTKQYGELFTGGPDFRFEIFLPGSLTAPFSIDNDYKQFKDGRNTVSAKLTRYNVRHHEWVKFYEIAHSNWVPEHDKIHLGLYEDDSHNFLAFSSIKFEPKVTYKKANQEITASLFSFEIKGNGNDFIGQYDMDRYSFFGLNNQDVYNGTRTDSRGTWSVYRLGDVYYTMPVVSF